MKNDGDVEIEVVRMMIMEQAKENEKRAKRNEANESISQSVNSLDTRD
jgi:hypothetical protein